ncbi:MAG: hypothetical protein ACRDH8_00005 [Actinomycetota bacterium]
MSKRSLRLRVLAVALGSVFLLTGPGALESVVAHEFDATSQVSLNVNKNKVKEGKKVTLRGIVTSAQPECVNGRQVNIVGGGGATAVADAAGNFKVRFTIDHKTTFTARVPATVGGPHPHRHACGADNSRSKQVKLKKKGND